MSDYIIKKTAMQIVLNEQNRRDMLDKFKSIPSVDVRENIHGEWEHGRYRSVDQTGESYDDGEAVICSVCRYAFKERYLWSRNFCPNCGADMRGE